MTTTIAPRRIVRLIGVPTDVNSSFLRGPAAAPPLVRAALHSPHANGCAEIGDAFGLDVRFEDAGDLPLAEADADRALIEAGVAAALAAGEMPFCIGGDHAISYPAVKAVAAHVGPVDILHFDAHPDIYDDYEGNPWSHASPFARILEAGLCKRLVQVGIRTMSPHLQDQVRKFGCVEVVAMRAFDPARVPVLEGPVYVSFDVDGLDPSVAPGVSHWEPGGLTVREAIAVLERQTAPIVGADLVEFNPVRDPSGVTAIVCAKMVREISALAARNGAPAPR
jgi:agmatinase